MIYGIIPKEMIPEIVFSIIHLSVVMVLRWFLIKSVKESDRASIEDKQKWQSKIRALALLVASAGLFVIWMRELYSVVLSLAAVGVAFVVGMKEVVMCMTGSFYRATTHSYTVGDRIEVDTVRGDVVDIGLLGTHLLEVGPGHTTHQYTGRMITVPHSLFFNHKVYNESFFGEYILHPIEINLKAKVDWQTAEKNFLQAMNEICSPFISKAKEHMDEIKKKRHLDPPRVEPRVHVKIKDDGNIKLVGRIVVPTRERGRLEQSVIRRYLELNLLIA